MPLAVNDPTPGQHRQPTVTVARYNKKWARNDRGVIVEQRNDGAESASFQTTIRSDAVHPDAIRLTPTQIRVMKGVHSGLLNKQIAFDLGIAEKTVKAHMTALMRKLNVRNRTQVAVAAQALLQPQG